MVPAGSLSVFYIIYTTPPSSGVTVSLFGGWVGWQRVGPDLRLRGGGGWVDRGLHRNYFFPITFIVHNHMSIGGGAMGVGWGWARPPPIVTPLTPSV